MAGDWIKMKTKLDEKVEFLQICRDLDVSRELLLFALYRLTCWLSEHGKYGNIEARFISSVDQFLPGLSAALESVDWLRIENDWVMLRGFTKAHSERKSIGSKLRNAVLAKSDNACFHCGSPDEIEIDHDVPIFRGGTSELSNLIGLCRSCNRRKWKKTYSEFAAEERKEAGEV